MRAGPYAHPPLNMHKALVFQAAIVGVVSVTVIGLKGEQNRRVRDEMEAKGMEPGQTSLGSPSLRDGSEEKKEA